MLDEPNEPAAISHLVIKPADDVTVAARLDHLESLAELLARGANMLARTPRVKD